MSKRIQALRKDALLLGLSKQGTEKELLQRIDDYRNAQLQLARSSTPRASTPRRGTSPRASSPYARSIVERATRRAGTPVMDDDSQTKKELHELKRLLKLLYKQVQSMEDRINS